MKTAETTERTYYLDKPFVKRIPWRVENFLVTFFNGDTAHTLIRFDAVSTEDEHHVQIRWGLNNLDHPNMYLVNEVPQPGKMIKLMFSTAPIDIVTGVPSVTIENPEGTIASPTLENQIRQTDAVTSRGSIHQGVRSVGIIPTVIATDYIPLPAGSRVTVKSLSTNMVPVYVGGVELNGNLPLSPTTGFELLPGEGITLAVNALNVIRVVCKETALWPEIRWIVEV